MAAQARYLDSQFYQTADAFFPVHASLSLSFDGFTLATFYPELLPRNTGLGGFPSFRQLESPPP